MLHPPKLHKSILKTEAKDWLEKELKIEASVCVYE